MLEPRPQDDPQQDRPTPGVGREPLSPVVEAVRHATLDDLGTIVDLARAAIAELAATKGGTVWARREGRVEPLEESIRAATADADAVSLVGTIDDSIVGYAIATVEVLPDGG